MMRAGALAGLVALAVPGDRGPRLVSLSEKRIAQFQPSRTARS